MPLPVPQDEELAEVLASWAIEERKAARDRCLEVTEAAKSVMVSKEKPANTIYDEKTEIVRKPRWRQRHCAGAENKTVCICVPRITARRSFVFSSAGFPNCLANGRREGDYETDRHDLMKRTGSPCNAHDSSPVTFLEYIYVTITRVPTWEPPGQECPRVRSYNPVATCEAPSRLLP